MVKLSTVILILFFITLVVIVIAVSIRGGKTGTSTNTSVRTQTSTRTGTSINNTSTTTTTSTPTLTFTPSSGPIGTLINISRMTGVFATTTQPVQVGGVPAIYIRSTTTNLIAMVMPGTNTGQISVTASDGMLTSVASFTVTPTLAPVSQAAKLEGTGADNGTVIFQGYSVAISGDGNTAAVGGHFDANQVGATWVFFKANGVWQQQPTGGKLVGSGWVKNPPPSPLPIPSDGVVWQGSSVALSADGNTLLIGALADNAYLGACWIFTRNPSNLWSQQGNKLVGGGASGASRQGTSVSLSADGMTALIGGSTDASNIGACWIFTKNPTTGVWAQKGSKLVPSNSIAPSGFGRSVSLSSDGLTALIGGWQDNFDAGAAWIFKLIGTSWSQQAKLTVPDNPGSNVGWSVSLNANGSIALLGGQSDNSENGAAWLFVNNGSTWSQYGTKLMGSNIRADQSGARFGSAVSLSADGNTLLIGATNENSGRGASYTFTRSGGVGDWISQNQLLGDTESHNRPARGFAVSLSSDGSTAVIGGPGDKQNFGSAWIFTP